MAAEPVSIPLPPPGPELDSLLATLPDSAAVFLLTASSGQPYLSKTALLGRRVRRLLAATETRRAALNLRGLVRRLHFWPTASRLESALTFYQLAREHYPDSYLKICNLRLPVYIRLLLRNEYPRTQISARPAARSLSFGPFRSRASAEEFEKSALDLFQIRRCQEDLHPSPDHPGCIYGEMAQCLRPCQAAVSPAEYASEVDRLVNFFSTEGRSLADTVEHMRDRFSADMEFEEAARQHRRLEKIHALWRQRDDLATLDQSHFGIAVAKSLHPNAVTLFFLLDGLWHPPVPFPLQPADGRPVSLDRRLREAVDSLHPSPEGARLEHLALLARWYYSSWRDGEWLGFPSLDAVPYRKVVNMIHRVSGV